MRKRTAYQNRTKYLGFEKLLAKDRAGIHESYKKGKRYWEKRLSDPAKKTHYRLMKKAHHAVAGAIKDGELVRPNTCSNCGSENKIYAHHPDYSKPLDIIWLCQPCHYQAHK